MNIRKFLWCLFHTTNNYIPNQGLDDLVYRCIWLLDNCPNVSVNIRYYYIRISTSSTRIEMWNANKFYAWLSTGSVNGRPYDKTGASKKAMYDFKECLKKHGYDIYLKEDKHGDPVHNIRINDVQC